MTPQAFSLAKQARPAAATATARAAQHTEVVSPSHVTVPKVPSVALGDSDPVGASRGGGGSAVPPRHCGVDRPIRKAHESRVR